MSTDREVLGSNEMLVFKATVRNGRIVLDEPTDLPDGHEVELCALNDDGIREDERRRLHQAIERGIDDARAGRGEEMGAFLDRLDAEP